MLQKAVNFSATTELEKVLNHSNVLFVVVATPSLDSGRYDHSQIDNLVQALQSYGQQT